MREILSGGSTLGAILVGPPGVLRRLLRIKAPQAGTSAALEGRQSLGALSALRPAARLGTPASFLCDEMPIGLEEGIVMTMLRNAGSLKNDKKFNMREIVIDTETIGLDFHADRIVEIGTVELIKRSPTSKTFHHHLCPLRERRGRCARPDGPCSSSTFHLNASPSERRWSRCRFLSRSVW